ncbi:MAG: hypothetical protein ACM3XS_07080 [Bacteroidota bacterium]
MFGFWGLLLWAVFTARLAAYAAWSWREGYRLGVVGLGFLSLAALGVLLAGMFLGNGLR